MHLKSLCSYPNPIAPCFLWRTASSQKPRCCGTVHRWGLEGSAPAALTKKHSTGSLVSSPSHCPGTVIQSRSWVGGKENAPATAYRALKVFPHQLWRTQRGPPDEPQPQIVLSRPLWVWWMDFEWAWWGIYKKKKTRKMDVKRTFCLANISWMCFGSYISTCCDHWVVWFVLCFVVKDDKWDRVCFCLTG